jgi:hypothetical protein
VRPPQNFEGIRSVPGMHGDRPHVGIMMTTSPSFSEHRSEQTATPHDVGTNGDESMDVKVRGEERRRPSPSTPEGYLQELPALALLDRLAIPMLAVRLDGVLVHTNPAMATMLGHQADTVALIGQPFISETVFVRASDQILLIGVTDVTERMWTIHPEQR